jgi:Protein of unknown function (DUF5818)
MRLKVLASMLVAAFLWAALSATSAAQGTEKRMAGGSKSVTGCVIKTDSGAYGIKTDEGTYQLNTDRDLSSFVGKQVRIDGTWKASGTVTTAPVGGATAAGGQNPAAAPAPAPSGAPSTGSPAFVGQLNLQITGTVVGDCAAPK